MESSDQAWQFFLDNMGEIRSCIQQLNEAKVPEFDQAVNTEDRETLIRIMSTVWNNAPDDDDVYDIPGFRELSDLLDGSIPGFKGDEP